MKKIKTIYRHLGYYNDFETIQSFCSKDDKGNVMLHSNLVEDDFCHNLIGNFIEDLDPDNPDTHLVVEDETYPFYYSRDKKFIFTTDSLSCAFDVDVEAEDYDPNEVDCDVYIDVYEFVGIKAPFSLKEFEDEIGLEDTEIIMGMSYTTDKSASMWHHFNRGEYADRTEWIGAFFREFVFQYNREDIKYLDVISRRDNKVFSF